MMKLSRRRAPTYAVQCHQLEMLSANMTKEESPEMQDLIQKHGKVFQDRPMKKPYRYPHHQKTEIERLIQELLQCATLIILEYIIKWKDSPKKTLRGRMKHFVNNICRCVCFEDKAFFREEGNVM